MANTYLTRTPSTTGNRKILTISCWFKRSNIDSTQCLLANGGNSYNRDYINFESNQLVVARYDEGYNYQIKTNRVFRDTSSWYHLVVAFDTTQGTASDRIKIYINGVQETSFATNTLAALDLQTFYNYSGYLQNIGVDYDNSSNDFNGLMSYVAFVDGTAELPTIFGETDSVTGQWKIKTDITPSVAWGTNGFLILKNGNSLTDESTNTNNFTLGGGTLTKTEDNPSNNFATLNPLDNYYANATFSNGNTKITTGTSREASVTATIPMFKGKYYWEAKTLSSSAPFLGIQPIPSFGNTASPAPLQLNGYGLLSTGKVETTNGSGGSIVLATYATYTAGDIIGIAVDLDSAQNKIYFYKNGSILGASGVNITSVGSTSQGMYLVAFGVIAGQDTIEVNFGNGYFGTTAVSSAGTNASGNGIFEYDVPTGYTALSTKGLNL
jgi:hypothetical protein